ncbi:hypothetical protein [Croceicoccus pelagius]|uniref:Uncharacterized protein n=1 Tax=Croceicoccus pelagius TaxID=1703341 RepID=A0A916YL92_9SPHN|nr:hypothetical protein [Croceicoccus pelagius]GGD50710.1 hypothetical protein GCM10010989_26130 [Croceicoccus pelagius]
MLPGGNDLRAPEGDHLAKARCRLLSDPEFVRKVQWWEDLAALSLPERKSERNSFE